MKQFNIKTCSEEYFKNIRNISNIVFVDIAKKYSSHNIILERYISQNTFEPRDRIIINGVDIDFCVNCDLGLDLVSSLRGDFEHYFCNEPLKEWPSYDEIYNEVYALYDNVITDYLNKK